MGNTIEDFFKDFDLTADPVNPFKFTSYQIQHQRYNNPYQCDPHKIQGVLGQWLTWTHQRHLNLLRENQASGLLEKDLVVDRVDKPPTHDKEELSK